MSQTPNPHLIDADTITGEMHPIRRVVIALGSNLGDRMSCLQGALTSLADTPDVYLTAVSPVYETDPWGGVDQGPFLNAVVVAEDPRRDAHDWLRFGQDLERAADRVRDRKWGPRTLDVDLVRVQQRQPDGALTEVVSSDSDLTLPHPLAHLRAFVLIPWLAVEPDAQLPVGDTERPVAGLVDELDATERDGVRPTGLVLHS